MSLLLEALWAAVYSPRVSVAIRLPVRAQNRCTARSKPCLAHKELSLSSQTVGLCACIPRIQAHPCTDTGDNLHFGLAANQARADGIPNVGILPVGDDVSVGRTKGALVGRRALACTILGMCRIFGSEIF